MTTRARGPLSRRLFLSFFALQLVLLAAFAGAVYLRARTRALTSFDAMLHASASALSALIEDDEDTAQLEFEYGDDVMPRFKRPQRPDLFAVLTKDGSVLRKSTRLDAMPSFVRPAEAGHAVHDFTFAGSPYRGIVLSVSRVSFERPGMTVESTVFFARSLARFERRLAGLRSNLFRMYGIALALSGALVALIAWRGLAPLRRLARDTEAIGVDELRGSDAHRLDSRDSHTEIRTVARAFNGLLDRVEDAFQRERRFAADAAHELRTPVATLKAGIQAAMLAHEGQDHDTLAGLLDDVDRLQALCESLLLLAEARTEELGAGLEAGDWWNDVEDAVSALAARHHAAATIEVAPTNPRSWPPLATTVPATRSIVTNLIDNAVAHVGPGVRIRIAATRIDEGVALTVTDDGPGIDEAFRPRLFERFARADAARARRTGGAGLGLAICDAMARAHGGVIEYQDAEPRGSRFTWRVREA